MEIDLFIELWLIAIMIYLLGHICVSLFPAISTSNAYLSLFSKLCCGVFLWSTIVACYFTDFHSILTLNFIALAILGWLFRSEIKLGKRLYYFEWKELLTFLTLMLLVVLIQAFRTGELNTDMLEYLSDVDYGVYTAVAKYLPLFGTETSAPWYNYFEESTDYLPRPYHYTDLWLLSCFLPAMSFNPQTEYVLAFIPFLTSIFIIGNIAIFKAIQKEATTSFLPFILVTGLSFYNAYFWIEYWSHNFMIHSILLSPKIFPMILLSQIAILSLLNKQKLLFAFLYSAIPIQSILDVPVILPGIFLWLLIEIFYFKNKIPRWALFIPIVTGLTIILFYRIYGHFSNSSGFLTVELFNYLFQTIRGLFSAIIKFIIYNITTLLFMYLVLRKMQLTQTEKSILWVLLFTFSSCIFAKALFNNLGDADQFFNLAANPLTTLALTILFSIRWKSSIPFQKLEKVLLSWIIIVPLGMSLFVFQQRDQKVDTTFMFKIHEFFGEDEHIGLAIANRRHITTYTEDPRICKFCNFLSLVGQGSWALRIDAGEQLFPERETAVALSPFTVFINKEKEAGRFENLALTQLKFAKKYCAPFLIVESGAKVPETFRPYIEESFSDPVSGVQFLILVLCD
ncbi:MAG: hypothetical protein MRY83_11740 [Flavobacteriales bacterium]|nr:hypothetical protein [Flavobacteriales bacterium]